MYNSKYSTKTKAWSLMSSIREVTEEKDRIIESDWMKARNHHQGNDIIIMTHNYYSTMMSHHLMIQKKDGNDQITNFIKQLFGNPNLNDKSEIAFEKYIYLSEIYQSVCTGSQAAFYRSRSGVNGTMGSLYWQLNDVWTTASWSSIDHSMRKKPLHFKISEIYADPVSIFSNQDETSDIFSIFAVSSLDFDIFGNLKLKIFNWNSINFEPLSEVEFEKIKISKNSATEILKENVIKFLNTNKCPYGATGDCFITFELKLDSNSAKSESKILESWHSPVPYKNSIPFSSKIQTKLVVDNDSCRVDEKTKMITFDVVASHPQPFVWVESTIVGGDFEKNNILISKTKTKFIWNPKQNQKAETNNCADFIKSLKIFYPAMVGF